MTVGSHFRVNISLYTSILKTTELKISKEQNRYYGNPAFNHSSSMMKQLKLNDYINQINNMCSEILS